jgi:hypothetical protein
MAHFAEIDENGTVLRVIVAEQDFIDSGKVGEPSRWKQTSYDTKGGVHEKGGVPLRKNFAGKGYTYDENLDAFIPPKEYASFVLNEEKGLYEPPVEMPKDGKPYDWDEATADWKEAVALDAAVEELKP